MRTLALVCITTALPVSSLLAADEKPKKEESTNPAAAAPLPLEATKASVRRKLIEQIANLERRIRKAEIELNEYPRTYGDPNYDTPMRKDRENHKDILIASQAQLIQALAELAKICD